MKLPMKFEMASKVAYLLFAGGGGVAILMMAAYLVAERVGVPQSAFLSLAGGIIGAAWLGLGADGLDRYWKRRHDEEMLKEVDRIQEINQAATAGMAAAGMVLQKAGEDARQAIKDWEDRRR